MSAAENGRDPDVQLSGVRLTDHIVLGTSYDTLFHTNQLVSDPRGTCYATYWCDNKRTREHCAVKIFNANHMDFSEDALLREVVLLKEMQTEQVTGVTGFVALFLEADQSEYRLVIDQWVRGEPLFECISHKWYKVEDTFDSRPYDEEDASTIFRGLCESLNELHSRDIMYGNLSPSTVILDQGEIGNVHLANMEWAEKLENGGLTSAQRGTPGYAAPEQLTGLRNFKVQQFGIKADIWSLGVILYQLLCGYAPFSGDGMDVIEKVQYGKYHFPEMEWRYVSDTAMDLIKRFLLRKNPDVRATTAQLLEMPWVTGEYFEDVRNRIDDGETGLKPVAQLSGSVRKMRLVTAKKKFRVGMRTLMARNALNEMLVGFQRENILLSIGGQYNETKLTQLYKLFEKEAQGELKKANKQGQDALVAVTESEKFISKQAFVRVIMKVLPDIAGSAQAAEAHFADFQGTRDLEKIRDAIKDLNAAPSDDLKKKQAKKAADAAKAQKKAVKNLIDYREYTVSISALCMKGDEKRRLRFIFSLFDGDRSGTLDRDEFAQLMTGILLTSDKSPTDLRVEMEREFNCIDEDSSGTIDQYEFLKAAESNPRLKRYFDQLKKMAVDPEEQAREHQDRMEQRRAAVKLQAAFRGKLGRRKMQDPLFLQSLEPEKKAFTRHIVYSHPIFDKEVQLSMPISDARMQAIKKLFALADLMHLGRLGPSQFRDLLKMLDVDVTPKHAMLMFREMDEDGGGFIEFAEFGEAMLSTFSAGQIEAASAIQIGNMGTRMWLRGEVAWAANSAMILCSCCFIMAGLVYFRFVLVPLLISYFLTFLMAPIMKLLEERPCIYRDAEFCRMSTHPTRIEIHGTTKASIWDLVHSCKFPHGASVLCTLVTCVVVLGTIVMVAILETAVLLDDDEFLEGWDQLIFDIDMFLNDSGVVVISAEIDGYTAEEITAGLSMFGGFFNQLALVLLLTTYIMSTFEVDSQRKPEIKGPMAKINDMMKFYIGLKTLLSLVTGIVTAVILLLCGVKLAIMFGILAFLLNYVPNFGSLVAMVLPIPIILVDMTLTTTMKIMGVLGPALVQGYVGNVLEPSVFGRSLNMTPMSILIALVLWMSIWGALGAVMAVPLLGIQKILLEYTNHPMAKGALTLIREDPNIDEEDKRMKMRIDNRAQAEAKKGARDGQHIIKREHKEYERVVDADAEYETDAQQEAEAKILMEQMRGKVSGDYYNGNGAVADSNGTGDLDVDV